MKNKQDSSLRTNFTWQVDTHMVLPQTKYVLIPHHAMSQIIYDSRVEIYRGLVYHFKLHVVSPRIVGFVNAFSNTLSIPYILLGRICLQEN